MKVARFHLAAAMIMALGLGGCAATQTSVAKRNLDVQTRMSDTIFLDPVSPSKQTVFVQIRNTSDKPELDVRQQIISSLSNSGVRVVDDPDTAHYWLQANVLQAGRSSETAAEAAYNGGFGSVITGAAGGAAIGGIIDGGNSGVGVVLGGLAGAAVSSVADAFVQDVTYTITTDIQLSERTDRSVAETSSTSISQGSSTRLQQRDSGTSDRKRYTSRVISSANKANLTWEEASAPLVAGLSQSLSGLF